MTVAVGAAGTALGTLSPPSWFAWFTPFIAGSVVAVSLTLELESSLRAPEHGVGPGTGSDMGTRGDTRDPGDVVSCGVDAAPADRFLDRSEGNLSSGNRIRMFGDGVLF